MTSNNNNEEDESGLSPLEKAKKALELEAAAETTNPKIAYVLNQLKDSIAALRIKRHSGKAILKILNQAGVEVSLPTLLRYVKMWEDNGDYVVPSQPAKTKRKENNKSPEDKSGQNHQPPNVVNKRLFQPTLKPGELPHENRNGDENE